MVDGLGWCLLGGVALLAAVPPAGLLLSTYGARRRQLGEAHARSDSMARLRERIQNARSFLGKSLQWNVASLLDPVLDFLAEVYASSPDLNLDGLVLGNTDARAWPQAVCTFLTETIRPTMARSPHEPIDRLDQALLMAELGRLLHAVNNGRPAAIPEDLGPVVSRWPRPEWLEFRCPAPGDLWNPWIHHALDEDGLAATSGPVPRRRIDRVYGIYLQVTLEDGRIRVWRAPVRLSKEEP